MINQKEYEVLKGLDERAKSIVRQDRGWLWVAEQPIMKDRISWYVADGFDVKLENDNLFQFIQWEDEEPYNIAELIEEYESSLIKLTPWTPNPLDFESEETEMKDIEWLKEEIWKQDIVMDKGYIYTDDLMSIINEVDEPEALSQEWIDENKKYTGVHDIGYYIPVNKLYGKIVPKQEELESKIKVLIEAYKQEEDAYGELENGWIIGFIKDLKSLVEEEQKYYVLDSDDIPLLERRGNQIQRTTTELNIHVKGRDNSRFELTEQEIKDYDKRFWPFAVKVEEVAE